MIRKLLLIAVIAVASSLMGCSGGAADEKASGPAPDFGSKAGAGNSAKPTAATAD